MYKPEVGDEVVFKKGCSLEGIKGRITEMSLNEVRVETETGDFRRVHPSLVKPIALPITPRHLKVLTITPDIEEFIAYLRTPEARCILELEARNSAYEMDMREQYTRLSGGHELVLGKGFRLAPLSANKQGGEGSVRFVPLQNYPEDVKELLSPDGAGHINRIPFLWLLVEKGFRIER